jgi:hypothetical protein
MPCQDNQSTMRIASATEEEPGNRATLALVAPDRTELDDSNPVYRKGAVMNEESEAVVAVILADWGEDDLSELIADWKAEGEDFIPQFADQLRQDLEESFSSWQDDQDGRLVTLGCMLLLSRVDWVAVVQQLVACAENSIPQPLIVRKGDSPFTGKPMATGFAVASEEAFESSDYGDIQSGPCPHCHRSHTWSKADAYVEGTQPKGGKPP